MLITHEELMRRLGSEKNLINRLDIEPDQNTERLLEKAKESERVVINTLASLEKPSDVAVALNCDIYDISDAKNFRSDEEEIKDRSAYTKERVHELALEKTAKALGLISDDKLENADLANLTKAALITSRIAERMLPRENSGVNNTIQISFNAPRSKRESDYRVIDVN